MESVPATSGDIMGDEEMGFLAKNASDKSDKPFQPLTKEELMRIDTAEPMWRRIRILLVVLFWTIWVGLIVASALFIAFTPRCPPRPILQFWESKVGYWVNPFAFKDSNSDLIGDLPGLAQKVDYVEQSIGAGYIILSPLSPFYPPNLSVHGSASFKEINPKLGTMDEFQVLLRNFKKKGLQVVLTFNFNAVPITHEMAKDGFLVNLTGIQFCRKGADPSEMVNGKQYYSTYGQGSGLVDLNLTSPDVLSEIENVVRFWLGKGVDGILLSDAAFFVETSTCNGTTWFDEFPDCKLYTNETISVIQKLRKVVDEVSKSTSRTRLLLADPGNTGYSADAQYLAESLLGTDESPGAHAVISREFTFNRGSNQTFDPSVSQYAASVNKLQASHLALTIASPSDRPYADTISTASVFLLPGSPIIYAGSELGWSPLDIMPPQELYPFGDKPIIDPVSSHLPMPWDSHGKEFSESNLTGPNYVAFIRNLHVTETVESVMAAGRGASLFSLTTSLIRLRKENPSLLWGDFNLDTKVTNDPSIEVFMRQAVGFDITVVVFVDSKNNTSVLDFSSKCTSMTTLLVYPPKESMPVGLKLTSAKVYFEPVKEETVYVFTCVA